MKMRYLIFFAFLLASNHLKAQTDLSNAQAMFVYNFIRNVNWPENSVQNRYVIGVVGNSDVFDALVMYTNGRMVGGKNINVVRCQNYDDMANCQVLYIPKSQCSNLAAIAEKLKNKSCLTVFDNCEGETPSLAAIDLVLMDGRLKYRVNDKPAAQQNIKLSNILVNMSI